MLRYPGYKGVNVVEENGREVFRLVSGDPNIYEGGWDTPQHMKDAVLKAIEDGYNMYPNRLDGLNSRLIASIVSWERRLNDVDYSIEDIIPTQGVDGAIRLLFPFLMEDGGELLLTDPTYIPYKRVAEKYGKAVFFRTIKKEGWTPDIDDIRRKISPETRALIIIHPQNPTGCLYDEGTLKELVDLAGEGGIPLISDEIYSPFILEDSKFQPLASVARDVPCLTMNSISKAYVATGWRVGHISIHDPEDRLLKLREEIHDNKSAAGTIPTPIAFGGIAAYRGSTDHIPEMNRILKNRRDLSHKRLNEIDGISATKPKAAFFIFPKVEATGTVWKDDYEFTEELKLEEGIAVNPGSYYGAAHSLGHFRIPYLPREEVLQMVFARLESFMKKHQS